MRRTMLAAAAVGLFAAANVIPALAQAPAGPPPVRVRGTIEKVDGDHLSVKARDGSEVKVALTEKTRLQSLAKKSLADIKEGDFLASVGTKGPDGKLHAVEVRIMPQALPGGGSQYAWDLSPDSMMTNAMVGTVSETPQGKTVHVKFKDGESEFSIGSDVPILAPMPGDKSLLKPGMAVFLLGPKEPDGSVAPNFIYIEKDGIKPPM